MEEHVGSEAEIFVGLILAATLKYGASWWMRQKRNVLFEKVGQVSKLYIYPVKSCKGIQLSEGGCTKYGIEHHGIHDRYYSIT